MSDRLVPAGWMGLRGTRGVGFESRIASKSWRPLRDGNAMDLPDEGPDIDAILAELATPVGSWEPDESSSGQRWTIVYLEETQLDEVSRRRGSYEARFLDVPNAVGPVLCVMTRYRYDVTAATMSHVPAARDHEGKRRGRPRKDESKDARTFVPPHPELAKNHRMTRRLVHYIERQAHRRTFAEIARDTGASEAVVAEIFFAYAERVETSFPRRLPKFLGIDNKVLGGRHYTQFTDLKAGKVIELVEGTNAAAVTAALARFEGHDRVKVVTMDLAKAYAASVERMLPEAAIIADKRHVLDAIRKRMNSYRSQIEKELRATGSDPSLLAYSFELMNKRRGELSVTEYERLQAVFKHDADLQLVYDAKEEWFDIFQKLTHDTETAGSAVKEWLSRWVTGEGAPAITRRVYGPNKKTIEDRFDHITAYFSDEAEISAGRRATNAATEALNGEIDRLYAQSRGFGAKKKSGDEDTMPHRLRQRVLHWCGERTWGACQEHLAGHHFARTSAPDDGAPPPRANSTVGMLRSLRIGDQLDDALAEVLKGEYERVHGVPWPFR